MHLTGGTRIVTKEDNLGCYIKLVLTDTCWRKPWADILYILLQAHRLWKREVNARKLVNEQGEYSFVRISY